MSEFPLGTIVVIRPEYTRPGNAGQTYRVIKVNPRTLGLENTGNGVKMKADPACVMLPPVAGSTVDIIAPAVAEQVFYPGQIVTATHVRYLPKHGLLIVLGQTARGYRLAALGGDEGRYYTSVPAKNLTLVSLDDATLALIGANDTL